MMQAFNAWLRVPEDKLRIIGNVISRLHNASLLQVFGYLLISLFPSDPPIVESMT